MSMWLRSRLGAMIAAVVLPALLSGCPPTLPTPSPTFSTASRIVFPQVATGPVVNGLATDAAWASGFRFVMEDGGPFPAATFRGVSTVDSVYLYAEVEDTDFNATDVLVIGLNPTGAPNGYHRIHFFPCPVTGVCPANGNSLDAGVSHWTGNLPAGGSSYTWTPYTGTSPVRARSATATAGSQKKWSVEVSIPRGAPFDFPMDNFFGLFVDVIRTNPDEGIDGTAVQYTWPAGHFIGATEDDVAELEANTPMPNVWGNASLSTRFGNGVTITSNDIRSNHPSDPGKIPLDIPVVFRGTAANYTMSGGTLVAANDVQATFKIANNGIPALGSYATVPGGVVGPVNIAPTVAHTFETPSWTLTTQERTGYTANPNQCIRVELTSTNSATIFINSSAMRNMQFVETSSPFRERAMLNTRGLRPPRGQDTHTILLRESFVNFDPSMRWRTEIRGATQAGERLYRADARPNGEHMLEIVVDPPPVRIPSATVRVPAGTGGPDRPAVQVEVRPNEVVTIIASGSVEIGGRRVSALGAPAVHMEQEPQPITRGPTVRGPGVRGAADRVGALVGSFDGFQTTFEVGNAATIKVPEGASSLILRIADHEGGHARQRGDGFTLQVVRTPIDPWMLAANPEVGRAVRGDDVFVTVGANLPTWILRGERDTGNHVRIGGRSFRVYESMGSFGYIVRRIQ
jgi:hypothetical protein